MRPTRRRLLRLGAVGLAGAVAGCVGAPDSTDTSPTATSRPSTEPSTDSPSATGSPTPTTDGTSTAPVPSTVGLETIASGFTSPVAFADPPGPFRYVVDQPGVLYAVDDDGRREEPALDLRDAIVDLGDYSERGLLGICPHPDFASNGLLYLRYSAPNREGTPSNYSHTFVLSEFQVAGDGATVDRGSERTILEIPEPQANHNGGDVSFGPDGFLYVGVGDGGAGGDQGLGHVDDWYDDVAGGNGQDVEANLLGSVLRIDPDSRDGDRPYGIPDDNPLVGSPGLDEHYAWGFRNPWRFAFTDDELFVGDVGQRQWEEIDIVERGGNYGWNVYEGTECFEAESCPEEADDGEPLRDPIVTYPHSGDAPSGIAVIGGYLYQGDAVPGLRGRYVFGDWRATGSLFVASRASDGQWPVDVVDAETPAKLQSLLAFGRGQDGELYVLTSESGTLTGTSGAVHRLVA